QNSDANTGFPKLCIELWTNRLGLFGSADCVYVVLIKWGGAAAISGQEERTPSQIRGCTGVSLCRISALEIATQKGYVESKGDGCVENLLATPN
ncbi:hypothetical protein QWJ41_20865, partial [Nocardioides sp. SOB44]